jgi:hypothetical protein
MSITIAVDVAKSIFEVAVSDRPGRVGLALISWTPGLSRLRC